jgi:transcriptional regulator with XRE-family HTH domain
MTRRRPARPVESLDGLTQRITTVRRRLGLSQRAFAKRLGVSQNIVGRWESGKHGLTARTLDRVAATGGVTTEWLLHGTAVPTRRRRDDGWTEAVAALEAAWRQPSRRRLVVRVLRALAAGEETQGAT